MNKEEAIEQLQRLNFDWEENGTFTKLNQTDINAIGIVCSELDIANSKIEKIREYINDYKKSNIYDEIRLIDNILSIIGEE